jgi:hypothetical protein
MTHPHPRDLTARQVRVEYETGRQAVEQVLGAPVALFRPPHGHLSTATVPLLRDLRPWLWSRDPEDWRPGTRRQHLETVVGQSVAGDVVLLHDWVEQAHRAGGPGPQRHHRGRARHRRRRARAWPDVRAAHRVTTPLVSVVMPFKDAGPFLEEAVHSVLEQRSVPLELLLVDDGGRDGSNHVAARLATAAGPRVRVLQHPGRMNLGTSAARARGVAHAAGEMIAFLDADDRWDPGHLRHEVDLLESHPEAAMVCGRAWRWWSWDSGTVTDVLTPLAFPPGVVVPPPRLLAAVLRHGALATPTCSLLVRAAALQATGGPPEDFGHLYEDQVVNTQLQLRFPAVMSGATSAWYRQHGRSATARAIRDGVYHPIRASASRKRFLAWLDGLPELRRDVADPELRELVDAALREQAVAASTSGRAAAAAFAGRRLLPPAVRQQADALLRRRGWVRLRVGSMLFAEPVSPPAGGGRGLPIDRFYVERFLGLWAEDVRGRVLEVGDWNYASRFGGGRVDRADALAPRTRGGSGTFSLPPGGRTTAAQTGRSTA